MHQTNRSNELPSQARLRGAFTIDEVFPYDNAPTVFGQSTPDSCVAACCKMLLNDETIPEMYLRIAVNVVKDKGANLQDVPGALQIFDSSVSYRYQAKLFFDELIAATEKRPALVSIKTSIIGHGYHAVIVDGFDAQMVLIRDPLPELCGSAYKITRKTFKQAWTGKAVIFDR